MIVTLWMPVPTCLHRGIQLVTLNYIHYGNYSGVCNVTTSETEWFFSDWANVLSGILQGTILDPILFIIYINDLPDPCHLYAVCKSVFVC